MLRGLPDQSRRRRPFTGCMPPPHISAEDMAAYLEGHVGAGERARIEAHLVACDACLDDVLALLGWLRSSRSPPDDATHSP